MSTKEEREQQQQKLDKEKYRRDKQLAILKASNQMLEATKDNIREKWGDDPMKMDELLNAIDIAKSDNVKVGKSYLNASEEQIEASSYGSPSKVYIDKYEKHLQNIGKTDSEMRAKSVEEGSGGAKVIASSESRKDVVENKWLSFIKKKKGKTSEDDDVVSEIDIKQRTVVGEGYIPPKSADNQDPEKIMERIAESAADNDTDSNASGKKKAPEHPDISETIEEKLDIVERESSLEYPEFDPSDVNPLTRYDIIELPSHGECYASKKARIPVRELTASDENLIASPNMYANGQLIETILRRCILDKNFNVDEMCTGDRDAVVMWLRATAFGPDYAVSAMNPDNGKIYNSTVNLGDFKYREFNLKGDENGHFDYTFTNGDTAKFKILSFKETQETQEEIAAKYVGQKKFIVHQKIEEIKKQVEAVFRQELADEGLNLAIGYIEEWSNKVDGDLNEETIYMDFVTKNIINRTVSINGNTDRAFVTDYINSLRLSEAKKYREYMFDNIPGVDFSFEIQIPESDGGGSVKSFLVYEDTVFLQ